MLENFQICASVYPDIILPIDTRPSPPLGLMRSDILKDLNEALVFIKTLFPPEKD